MDIDKIAKNYAGKITFWGELDRQKTLPYGTREDIIAEAREMIDKLYVNGGGLIGQSVAGVDVPIENLEAVLSAW